MINTCEHVFCRPCLMEWLKVRRQCPMDRAPLNTLQLKPVPRIVRSMLGSLNMTCEYGRHGCQALIKVDSYPEHSRNCPYRNGPLPRPGSSASRAHRVRFRTTREEPGSHPARSLSQHSLNFSDDSGFQSLSTGFSISQPSLNVDESESGDEQDSVERWLQNDAAADVFLYHLLLVTMVVMTGALFYYSLQYFDVTVLIIKIGFIAFVFKVLYEQFFLEPFKNLRATEHQDQDQALTD